MDIKEVLASDEGKAAIAAAIDEATKGLKAKNDELLGGLKKEKDDRKTLQEQIDEIKTAKELAEQEAAEKSGDIEKVKQSLVSAHTKELDALKSQLSDKDSKLHGLLVDNGLTDALSKSGVAPQYMDAAKALIQTHHKPEIADVDGKVIAQLDGKPLTDFVSEWAQGDQGKHFKAAPDNGGGGANGANGGGKALSKGDMAGDRKDRQAAIASKYPELNK